MSYYTNENLSGWIPIGPIGGGQPSKKIIWKKASLSKRFIGWAGFLTCENFTFDQYKELIEWCREGLDDNSIRCHMFSKKRSRKHVDGAWVNSDVIRGDIILMKIYFKNKYDAIAFKIAWAGE